jgi:hypothetical protein
MTALDRHTAADVEVLPAPAPLLPAEALDRLPAGGDVDPYWRIVAAFVVAYPAHSSRAYFGDEPESFPTRARVCRGPPAASVAV